MLEVRDDDLVRDFRIRTRIPILSRHARGIGRGLSRLRASERLSPIALLNSLLHTLHPMGLRP